MYPTKSRFPLTHGRPATPAGSDGAEPSDGRRPFGLRFFARETLPPATATFSYCEEQQVTVDDEGHPVVQGPNASWSQTTTGNMDGNEETKMDQDPDSN
jgi:putative ATP-grasp target RiPP